MLYFKNKKNAQIGIFVIISIIIVVLGIVFFSYNSGSIKIFNDQKSSYKVKEFVESCLNLETNKAIDKIALHGGWEYSPYSENSNILFADSNTNKYLIKSAKGYRDLGGVNIPYWYYYDDSAKEFKFNIPDYDSSSKYSIKNQVKRYLNENLDKECLDHFNSFKDIYNIDYDPKKIDNKIIFDKDNLKVELNLDLKIDEINTNNTEYISDFSIKQENKLYTAYHLAKDITLSEANFSFIEKRILNFMSPYESASRRDLLPPRYEYRMTYDFRPWEIKNVEKVFREILSSNINYIQFLNTDYKEHKLNDKLKDSEFAKALNKVYTKDYLSENSKVLKDRNKDLFNSYKNYRVSTKYESFFPTFFSISPSMGDVILLPRPESIINLIPFFFTEYVATYEITNPILFEIRKSNSPNEKFLFNLAIESNIDYNAPLKEKKTFNFNLSKLDLSSSKSLICNPNQRISDWVTINLTDPMSGGKRKFIKQRNSVKYKSNMKETGVDSAIVTFDCKGLATCTIGQTSINAKTKKGADITQLKFRLPVDCNPGKLEITKFGYQKLVFNNLDPKIKGEINLGHHYMSAAKKINLSVKLLDSDKNQYSLGKSLKNNETGFLIFENKETSDFVKVVEISKENQFNLNISLIPGNYSVKGFVMYGLPTDIPSEQVCYKKGLFSGKDCQTIPGFKLKSWIIGGIDLNNYEVTAGQLLYNNKLVVPFVNFGVPHNFDELSKMSNAMASIKNGKKPYFE